MEQRQMSKFCIDLEGMMLPDAIAAVVEAWYDAQSSTFSNLAESWDKKIDIKATCWCLPKKQRKKARGYQPNYFKTLKMEFCCQAQKCQRCETLPKYLNAIKILSSRHIKKWKKRAL
jgi:hypothetical protein